MKNLTIEEALSRPTISVQDAGRLFFGLGRNAAYNAAENGDFDTIRVRGRILVADPVMSSTPVGCLRSV